MVSALADDRDKEGLIRGIRSWFGFALWNNPAALNGLRAVRVARAQSRLGCCEPGNRHPER